jgi:hypothetical protein
MRAIASQRKSVYFSCITLFRWRKSCAEQLCLNREIALVFQAFHNVWAHSRNCVGLSNLSNIIGVDTERGRPHLRAQMLTQQAQRTISPQRARDKGQTGSE